MMPQWEAASEVWLHRMILGLSQDLAAIVVNDSRGNSSWREKVPAISLRPQAKKIRYLSRLFDVFGLALEKATPGEENILRNAIHQLSITHILCHYGTFAVKFMNIWREVNLPLFVHFHGYDAAFDLRLSDQPDKRLFPDDYLPRIKELEHRAIFITNSEFTKSLLVDAGVASDRVVVKYYGVPVPEEGRIHKRKGRIQILHLGRLVDCKSPDRTIAAFEIAKAKGLDGHLIIAGDGPLKITCELIRVRSPYKDSIHILGSVNPQRAQTIFSESDIFTQHNIAGEITKQTEALGVSIIEAMAIGLPVVGTRNGGVLETVVDGETGILIDSGNIEAQADAFLKLARNPNLRQQLGDAGRARVADLLSPQREMKQLRTIMRLPQIETA